MKSAVLVLIVLHGLIHLLGFAKAFNLVSVNQLTQPISKPGGVLWLASSILFIITALLFFLKKDSWWMLAAVAIIISQYMIFTNWHDAKFGTIANVIILVAAIIGYGTWNFSKSYRGQVATGLKQTASIPDSTLTESDIKHLPEPVRKYLRYTGSLDKPKVKNFKVEFSGQIRENKHSEWMHFTSEQYNFVDASTRLFFLKATMKHLPVSGFHCFKNGSAFMDIRLLSLFRVQYQSGEEMDVAETVTFFNDMCCMAPATLIDPRIQWLEVKGNMVNAAFTDNSITITAWLYFNDKGELTNFISDDRYAVIENNALKKLRWSTPLKDYKKLNEHTLAGYAETIYSYPDGDFAYGNFRLTNIEYNSKAHKRSYN